MSGHFAQVAGLTREATGSKKGKKNKRGKIFASFVLLALFASRRSLCHKLL
jgi:hypothetical protein